MLWSDFERLGRFWDPWAEFDRMQRALSRLVMPSTVEFPPVNVWASEEEAIVTTEIPGVDPDSIDISVAGESITIRGSREPEKIAEGETYHRRERWSGQFTKTIDMPFTIEKSKVEATFSKGILTIVAPRAEEEKPKKIAVKSD